MQTDKRDKVRILRPPFGLTLERAADAAGGEKRFGAPPYSETEENKRNTFDLPDAEIKHAACGGGGSLDI